MAYHLHPPVHLNQTRIDLTNDNQNAFVKFRTVIRTISSYIGRCFDQRWKFLNIINKLKKHFKDCRSFEKHKYIKLIIYFMIPIKLPLILLKSHRYIDLVTNPTLKYRTTRLRISLHVFSTKKGHYQVGPSLSAWNSCLYRTLTAGTPLGPPTPLNLHSGKWSLSVSTPPGPPPRFTKGPDPYV